MSFHAGKPLANCENEIVSFIEALESRNRESSLSTLRSLLHLIRNLRGENVDHTKETAMDGRSVECASQSMTNMEDRRISIWANYHAAFLSYVFGDFVRAAELIKNARPLASRMFPNVESSFVVMLDGLIKLTPGRHRSVYTARRCIRILKRETRKAPHQLLHCLYFLQAELAVFLGSKERAIVKFQSAIAIASASRFRADLGNALERFGDFYAHLGDEETSIKYYHKAADAFREWGATAKESKMYSQHSALLSDSTSWLI
jgi:tetratricopeptide (TPR) repeat protein